MTSEEKYPECTKLASIAPVSQKIGEFLDWWMSNENRILAEGYRDYGDIRAWFPTRRSLEVILAEFFEIDLEKVEAEKRVMLDEIRRLEDARPSEKDNAS